MNFHQLRRQLITLLKARLGNGELSERRLALLTGISQPHIHNVLKGRKKLSPELADLILSRLGISVMDLLPEPDLLLKEPVGQRQNTSYQEVPVFEGWLGPGLPLPKVLSRCESYPFPKSFLAPLHKPAVARLAADPAMANVLSENDLVLLDHSAHGRTHIEPGALYVINRRGEGLIRRLSFDASRLHFLTNETQEDLHTTAAVPVTQEHILDIVCAKVVWIGRRIGTP